ncbi:hypothetical protein CCR75_001256 [Bremia lactucae]|uniref:Uncharacterized protein n=1 Tax=Bremia lactucae TaxID=4779 RepID=A0A976NXX1_BRELC|nr:hypothetical protein CCR75_001256 [Bremia lactucae]
MINYTALRLPKAAARCIKSSTPSRLLQQSSASARKTNIPPISEGEKAWCDIYGVDYKKQIAEALQECPVVSDGMGNKTMSGSPAAVQAKRKTDARHTVFSNKKAS